VVEIVFQMIASVFEDVVILVFDFPATATDSGDELHRALSQPIVDDKKTITQATQAKPIVPQAVNKKQGNGLKKSIPPL
jgi:hypothetical protein